MHTRTIILLAVSLPLWTGCSAPFSAATLRLPPPAEVAESVEAASLPAQLAAEIRLPTPTQQPALIVAVATPDPLLPELHNWGLAPELTNEEWLNSPPLRLADLRGKVVMVEFWTFGCINCQHVTPTLQQWHQQYSDQGLVIIGVHTPEFAYEREVVNVAAAAERAGITWPVAIDNERQSWQAYNNHYWPAMYIIDKQGNIRYLAIGEGNYGPTEAVIKKLLAE